MAAREWDDLINRNERSEYGQAWLPDREPDHPGTLVGTVVGYDQGPLSEYSGQQPWICAILDRDGKLWSVWLNRTVLTSEFERHRPLPEERIVVRYRGRQAEPSRPGAAAAHLYTVTVDRPKELPGFITAPVLEEGEVRRDLKVEPGVSDVPADAEAFTVPDADVVDDRAGGEADDDPLPF